MRRDQRVVLLALVCWIGLAAATGPLIQTAFGPVQGTTANGVDSFRGIPFAKPPLGQLRWAPPQPTDPWAPNVWDATRYRGDCPQPGNYSSAVRDMDEDCLYLNIYTPTGAASASAKYAESVHLASAGGMLSY